MIFIFSIECLFFISLFISPFLINETKNSSLKTENKVNKTNTYYSNLNNEIIENYSIINTKYAKSQPISKRVLENSTFDLSKNISNVKKEIIFDNTNVRNLSNLTVEELSNIFQKKGTTKMIKLSESFINAEKKYNVNALFLVSIVGLESGWLESSRSKNGYYNITGMGVEKDSDIGIKYNSYEDCILDTARQLDAYYLKEDGKYYKGLSTKDINFYYCESKNWYSKINQIGNELIELNKS